MARSKNKDRQEPTCDNESNASKHGLSAWWRRKKAARKDKQSRDSIPDQATPSPSAGPKDQTRSLWNEAYSTLQVKHPQLVEKYEKLLSRELASEGADPGSDVAGGEQPNQKEKTLDDTNNEISCADPALRQLQLDRIIKSGLKRVEGRKTRYRIAGQEFIVQDQAAQAVEMLEWAKDWIDTAVQGSPQAATAWAAICLALPFFTKPSTAGQTNRDGLAYVTARMRYYVELESLLLARDEESHKDVIAKGLKNEFEEHLIELYRHILDFQIRSVLRFYRGSLQNFGRDIGPGEDWNQMRKKIEDLEKVIYRDSQQVNSSSSRVRLENLAKNAEKSFEKMRQLFMVAVRQLQVSEEHRDVSIEQLLLKKQALEAKEKQKAEECLQLFRLQKGEKDETYEWYKNRVEDRVEGTCQWFLSHDRYHHWLNQESGGPLLVTADPGCGKSVLAKYLINDGLPKSNRICYFFFKDQLQNTLKQALCAWLHQLFCMKTSLIRHALPAYRENNANLVNNTALLWSILCKTCNDAESGSLIFVLDALDECERSDFEYLVHMLKDELQHRKQGSTKVRYLFTSRPYEQITTKFEVLVKDFPFIRIPGEDESPIISREVNCVIQHRVNQLAEERNLKNDVKEHLLQRLLEIPHRTYLWAYLVFDYLEQGFKKTKRGIDAAINTLPSNVNQAYDKILSKSTNKAQAEKTLSIILVAKWPLTLGEMNVAVNIEPLSKPIFYKDLDLEDEKDFKETLRNWCGLFVSFYDGRVHFLHQTAREFLVLNPSYPSPSSHGDLFWRGSIDPQRAHCILAKICIAHLKLHDFDDKPLSDLLAAHGATSSHGKGALSDQFRHSTSDQNAQSSSSYDTVSLYYEDVKALHNSHVFLKYSALNWISHFHEGRLEDEIEITPSVLDMCDPQPQRFRIWFGSASNLDILLPNLPITVVSFFGFNAALKVLLEREADVNVQDRNKRTALHWASWNSSYAVAELLLDSGANPNARDNDGETATFYAAFVGDVALAQLLLNNGVDVNERNNQGQTPLHYAAKCGKSAVVELLLSAGSEADAQDHDGRTALCLAVMCGDETIVQLILDKSSNVNARDYIGDAPLDYAARHGRAENAKLLLDAGVDINAQNKDGWTALHCAVAHTERKMIRLLLDRGANYKAETRDGMTVRDIALKKDEKDVLEMIPPDAMPSTSHKLAEIDPLEEMST